MNRTFQVLLITAGCTGAYVGMRSLPVKPCTFLHYGDYVNRDGVIEGCGYEETQFFVMKKIRFPIIATLNPLSDPERGRPVKFDLSLFTTTGKPIEWEGIAISHAQRIHAMIVDPSLQDYHHIHPQPAGPPGHYVFEMTPARSGNYTVYLDFIPLITSRRTLLETDFTVPGKPDKPVPGNSLKFQEGNLAFDFQSQQDKLVAGQKLQFHLQVNALDGAPTRFSPVMNSYAHVVAFDEHNTGFAHMHPRNPFIEGQDPLHPELDFVFLFDKPGYYRVWAQMIINNRQVFVPFDLMVKPA